MIYYEPKDDNLSLADTMDLSKYQNLINEINNDLSLSAHQSYLLSLLATRQIEFKYNKIADYYAKADSNIKEYLEKMHLVILDKDRAIETGLFKYFDEYEKLVKDVVDEK